MPAASLSQKGTQPDADCPHRLRWLRVPAFTVPSVALAVLAHVAAGGPAPDPVTVAVLLGCVALVAAGLGTQRRRLPHLLIGVGLVQVGVHVALLDHHAVSSAPPLVGASPMVLAHVVASVVLAWWLTKGEAALWRRVRRLTARLRRLLTIAPVEIGHMRLAGGGPEVGATTAVQLLRPAPRGPPARS